MDKDLWVSFVEHKHVGCAAYCENKAIVKVKYWDAYLSDWTAPVFLCFTHACNYGVVMV